MDDERSLGPKETGAQAAAPIFIAYMKEALKGQPVVDFPETSTLTTLAKKTEEASAKDDEAADKDESFYPEEEAVKERKTDRPQASSQQFFKEDLEE
jgi:penicillin-binding protein 1A